MEIQEILQYLHFPRNNYLFFSLIFFLVFLVPIIARKINFPFIFIFILVGILAGPKNLNIIDKTPIIDFFGKVGLIYIMFLAGLELNLPEFLQNKHRSLVFGMFTFWLPLLLAFPLCYYVIKLDFLGSLLVSSIFSTHTLLAYPIVSKLGLTQREEVVISVSGTMITDTLVLVLFIFISNYARGIMQPEFIVFLLAGFAVYSLIIFFVLTKIARWFFQRIESETHLQLALVYSLIFFSVYLAESFYLEAIIGAFAAGLALNRLIPNTSVLMQRIEFVGNAIFIPVFLISVGMIIDPSVLFKNMETFSIAILLSVSSILTKGVAAYALNLFFPFSFSQTTLIFGLTSAHAAATLAVILVGYELKIVDEVILNSIVILIMMTSLFSSFLTEFIAKKIALQPAPKPDGDDKNGDTGNILIPVINLDTMDRVLFFSQSLANSSSQPISILTVVENNRMAEENIKKAKKKIESFLLEHSSEKSANFQIHAAIETNPASGIVKRAKEIMADIIILGWPRKASLIDKFFGIEKIKTIIENSNRHILITQFHYPLHLNKKAVIFLSEHAEKEKNFAPIFQKITGILEKWDQEIHILASQKTQEGIKPYLKNHNKIKQMDVEWKGREDLERIFKNIHKDDLVIFFCSRKGFISYQNVFDSLIEILEEIAEKNNKILIYPKQETFERVIV